MKNFLMNKNFLFVCLILEFLSCVTNNSTQTAGGAQDFPNALAPVSALTIRSIHEMSTGLPNFTQNALIPSVPNIYPTNLQKRARATGFIDTTWWDLKDSLNGTVFRFNYYSNVDKEQTDTALIKYTTLIFDTLRNNDIVLAQWGIVKYNYIEITQKYKYQNTNQSGSLDEGVTTTVVRSGDSIVLSLTTHDFPGADSSLQLGFDNLQDSIHFERYYYSKRVLSQKWIDKDGDKRIFDLTKESNMVSFSQIEETIDSNGNALKRSTLIEANVKTYDPGSSILLSYASELDSNDNITSIKITRLNIENTITNYDTAQMFLIKKFVIPDSCEQYEANYNLLLPKKISEFAGIKITSHSSILKMRSGIIKNALFTFIPDSPLSFGQLSWNGKLTMSCSLINDFNAFCEGSIHGITIQAFYIDPDGGRYRTIFDTSGKLTWEKE